MLECVLLYGERPASLADMTTLHVRRLGRDAAEALTLGYTLQNAMAKVPKEVGHGDREPSVVWGTSESDSDDDSLIEDRPKVSATLGPLMDVHDKRVLKRMLRAYAAKQGLSPPQPKFKMTQFFSDEVDGKGVFANVKRRRVLDEGNKLLRKMGFSVPEDVKQRSARARAARSQQKTSKAPVTASAGSCRGVRPMTATSSKAASKAVTTSGLGPWWRDGAEEQRARQAKLGGKEPSDEELD